MSSSFKFKQFTIQQDRCAMKIGTDGVLLGAWVSLENKPQRILDIGTGTGIIALQLAQRCEAEIIEAVEINPDAFEQCVENFENSPWENRLFCYHASIQEFAKESNKKQDLIITNPPFYSENSKTKNEARDTARFTNALSFKKLIEVVSNLLSEEGVFALILPKKEEEKFIALALEFGLFPKRICRVQGTVTSEIKRSLLEFSFERIEPRIEHLTIEISRHNYTNSYISLVRDFYLKM